MYSYLHWHAFFKANTEDKVRKLLAKFEDVCETKVTQSVFERYWKDSSLYDVGFSTLLNKDEITEAVFSTLFISHKLAYTWEVTGPSISESGIWQFRGLTTNTKVTGIEWIQFRLETDS